MTATPNSQDTPDALKIIVLDDDRMSSHNLSIQLKFVGEIPLVTTCDNWQQMLMLLAERDELTQVLAIAIGSVRSASLVDLLLQIHLQYMEMPLLLLSAVDNVQLSGLPDSLKARLLPLGDRVLNYQSLLAALKTARQLTGRDRQELRSRLFSPTGSPLFRSLSGESPRIKQVRQLILQAAKRPVCVLIVGESGTGKEVVARNLHYHGGRADKPFLAVNCAAVAPERFAGEFFGIEQGYLGGGSNVPGLLEKANGGTVLFDEISELPLPIQGSLLRFLEDRSFQRVGGHEVLTSDVRVVVGTRHDLLERVQRSQFREDLYYRISVLPIELPPLRERVEDIPDLLRELISSFENKGYESIRFNSSALHSLQQHHWPGNVRELANLVERLALMHPDAVLGVNDLPPLYRYADNGVLVAPAQPSLQSPAPALQSPEPVLLHQSADSFMRAATEAMMPLAQAAEIPTPAPVAPVAEPLPVTPAAAVPAVEPAAPAPTMSPTVPPTIVSVPQHPAPAPEIASVQGGVSMEKAMPPLNSDLLRQYLAKFERHILEVALDDCAGLLDFTAERMQLDMELLKQRLQSHGLLHL